MNTPQPPVPVQGDGTPDYSQVTVQTEPTLPTPTEPEHGSATDPESGGGYSGWGQRHFAGELLETGSFLNFLRTTVFGPLLAQRHGLPVRVVRRLKQALPPAEPARSGRP